MIFEELKNGDFFATPPIMDKVFMKISDKKAVRISDSAIDLHRNLNPTQEVIYVAEFVYTPYFYRNIVDKKLCEHIEESTETALFKDLKLGEMFIDRAGDIYIKIGENSCYYVSNLNEDRIPYIIDNPNSNYYNIHPTTTVSRVIQMTIKYPEGKD